MLNAEPVSPQQSDLEIDTGFDVFSQLDDIQIDGKPVNITEPEEYNVEPHELEIDEDDFFNLDDIEQDENGHDIDEDAEEEPEYGLEDDVFDEELKSMTRFAQEFDTLPDDTVFNVAGIELTKEQVTSLAQQNETVSTAYEAVDALIQRDQELSVALNIKLQELQTETMGRRRYLEGKLNDPYVTDVEKMAHYKELQGLSLREGQISKAGQDAANLQAQRIQQAKMERLNMVSQELDKRYDSNTVTDVFNYAVSQGINQNEMLDNASVQYFEALNKARLYDNMMAKSKDKFGKVEEAKVAKAKAKAARKPKQVAKRTQIEKAMDTGSISDLDLFNFLED